MWKWVQATSLFRVSLRGSHILHVLLMVEQWGRCVPVRSSVVSMLIASKCCLYRDAIIFLLVVV